MEIKISSNKWKRVDWKRLYRIVCVLLIVFNVILLSARFQKAGWDFKIYAAAVRVFMAGENPYLVSNLIESSDVYLPFIYPPSTLYLFFPITFLAGIVGYRILWLLLLVASFFIVKSFDRSFRPFSFATMIATGFMASYHNFRTGNVGLIELFFYAWAFKFIYEKKYALSSIFINLTAWLKIYPVLIGALFIFLKQSLRAKMRLILMLSLGFAVVFGASLVLYPQLSVSNYLALRGKIEGQPSPSDEIGGSSNPSSFLFIREIGERFLGTDQTFPLAVFIIYAAFILWCLIRDSRRKDLDFATLFSIGTLAILLLLPRLKPYSLTLALIPVYFLMKDMDYRQKLWGLFIVGLLPLGLSAVYFVLREMDLSSIWIGRQVYFISGYRQLFSLLIAFIYLRRRISLSRPGRASSA